MHFTTNITIINKSYSFLFFFSRVAFAFLTLFFRFCETTTSHHSETRDTFRFSKSLIVSSSTIDRSGASAISEEDIFRYSCSAQLISFEIESTSKEINCAEHEYMNMSPSLIALAPLLTIDVTRPG